MSNEFRRLAGWSAHILEDKRTGRLVRPSAQYIGPDPRAPQDVEGWGSVTPLTGALAAG